MWCRPPPSIETVLTGNMKPNCERMPLRSWARTILFCESSINFVPKAEEEPRARFSESMPSTMRRHLRRRGGMSDDRVDGVPQDRRRDPNAGGQGGLRRVRRRERAAPVLEAEVGDG